MRNADIDWHGTFVGLMPQVQGAVAQRLIELGITADEALVEALADPDRFAAAHVVLTQIHYKKFMVSADEWNGLRVDLLADGRTVLFPEQRSDLQRRWREQLRAANPRMQRTEPAGKRRGASGNGAKGFG